MKSFILSESNNRTEYKRRWKAMERAKKNGLDTALIDLLYAILIRKGYSHEIATESLYMAARDGVFGLVNSWER